MKNSISRTIAAEVFQAVCRIDYPVVWMPGMMTFHGSWNVSQVVAREMLP